MPYTRRAYRRRAPYRRRAKRMPGFATRPRMFPRTLALQRKNQVSTKVFYFKLNGQSSTPAGIDFNYFAFRTQGFTLFFPPGGPPFPPPVLSNVPQRNEVFALYDQFKVLAIKMRWFPSNVGTEPGQPFQQGITNRGDQVIWSDQRFDLSAPEPTQISEVLNHASARMIQPRRYQTRTLYRPKGHPEWGSCENPVTNPDPWNGAIQMLVNNATPDRPLWFYTLTYKVVVRGRRQN